MAALPVDANAHVLSITRKGENGPADGYDAETEAVDAEVAFEGRADAFLRVRNVKVESASGVDYVRETTINIPAALAELYHGDIIEVDKDGDTHNYVVRDFEKLPALDAFRMTRVVVERA